MNISATSMQQMQKGPGPVGKPMTDEQRSTATSILEKYDSSNMDKSSIRAMKKEFKEAGISPSKDLGDMLKNEGFELRGPKGGRKPQGTPPGGGKGAMGGIKPTDETADLYKKLIDALDEGEDESIINIAKKLTGNVDASGIFVDEEA